MVARERERASERERESERAREILSQIYMNATLDRKVAFGADSMEGDMEGKIARVKMRLANNTKFVFLKRLLGRVVSGPAK